MTKPSLNNFQRWALMYWLWMDQRLRGEDTERMLERQTFHLFPERWLALYQQKLIAQVTPEPEEEPVTDIDMLDRFYEQMGGLREMSGAGSNDYWEQT